MWHGCDVKQERGKGGQCANQQGKAEPMTRAYFQCPACRRVASIQSSGPDDGPQRVECGCRDDHMMMTFRGYGEEGRRYFPHGSPPKPGVV